jgi:hypothetical protein
MRTNWKVVGLAVLIVVLNVVAVSSIGLGYDRYGWVVFSQAYDPTVTPPPHGRHETPTRYPLEPTYTPTATEVPGLSPTQTPTLVRPRHR